MYPEATRLKFSGARKPRPSGPGPGSTFETCPPSARWFRLAAEQGYEKAQSKMASRYAKGRGVSANMVEALKWAILAAEQGSEGGARMRDD